jgi:uncharacterized membrane-anchored protein
MSDVDFRYLEQLVVALVLTSVTVVVHGLGMNLVRRYFRRSWSLTETRPDPGSHRLMMIGIVAIMIVTHSVEILIWALFYTLRGLVPHWLSAVYFSIASYTTLGESGITLPGHWQGLGGFEAMAAMLMFGWSTAMLAAVILKVQSLDT